MLAGSLNDSSQEDKFYVTFLSLNGEEKSYSILETNLTIDYLFRIIRCIKYSIVLKIVFSELFHERPFWNVSFLELLHFF